MSISPQLIKTLRDETGAGFMDCKSALEQRAAMSKKHASSCARRAQSSPASAPAKK
jgi:translation elongation factor EF-Ts